MADKIFIWKVDVREWKYWEFTTISFWPQDIVKIKENLNEKGWISMTLKEKKAWGKYLEVFQKQEGETNRRAVTVEDFTPQF